MEEKKTKRKLTAILSADVKGYSNLMQDDEEATVRTITAYRVVMTNLIQGHDGRVVDAKGDNVLAEFASVVDAVRCAVEIQKELNVKNEELSENRKMEFRIGINLGDVIEEEGTIYGDGVNIAARLEGLAEGGGICISRMTFDNVKNKLNVGYEYLGEHSVKNIAESVRVYKVLMEPEHAGKVIGEQRSKLKQWRWAAVAVVLIIVGGALAIWNFYFQPPPIEPASLEKMAFPLPDKPSIAVLPLDNMSGDPKQDYFSDGLTEQIISALSKVPKLFVIARNSTFIYKGKPVRVQQVAEELGVRYVLEGSVRKAGDTVRVTAQLVDALGGHHLWSETYDRNLRDIFAIQDEITMKILTAMQVKLTSGEGARLMDRGTKNLKAYLKFLDGIYHYIQWNKEANFRAKQLLEEAIALDSDFGLAYCGLGNCHFADAMYGWSKSPPESMQRAFELAEKALSLDDSLPCSYNLISKTYLFQRRHAKAIAKAEQAVELSPNASSTVFNLGWILRSAGRPEEGISLLEKAVRLDPFPHSIWFDALGRAYFLSERYEEAIAKYRKAVDVDPDYLDAHVGLASTYATLGREEEARTEVAEILRIKPNFSIKWYANMMQFQVGIESEIKGLRKAGLPETPPLPLPDKPSIAVLPFTNISSDPEQEYFADGMTDTLITDLSKISGLFIIARNSVFTYKGKPVKVAQIGRELGVRYVMEGSVQRADNQVRINAQLIDTKTGGHLWAERYDGTMDNIFALQDKITGKIVTALAVKLTASEQEQVTRKGTDNMEAYDAFLKGQAHYLRRTRDDFRKAVFYFKRAIELDPNYGRAYAGLGWVYWDATAGWLDINWTEARDLALKYLQLAMKNPTPDAHALAGRINSFLRLHKEAISEAERALALAPNDPSMHGVMAHVLIFAGRPKEAIKFAEFEMRHDPRRVYFSLFRLGLAQFSMGKYEQAASYFERGFKHNPEFHWVLAYLAATYAHLGRTQEARAALEEFTRKVPAASHLRNFMYFCPFTDMEVADRLADGVLKAGLTGQPSGYYKISEKNRLTGKELRELVLGTDSSKYWIAGNMLCTKKWKWLSGCYPVFRNSEGTPERNDEYLLIHGAGFLAFNTIPRLKEEAVEALDMKWIEWASDADGFGKDGIFTRKNPPAFSFDYPADFRKRKPSLGKIFDIRSPGRSAITLRVLKITGDVNESLQGSAEHFEKAVGFQATATDIKVIYNKPLPPDTYGEYHPAYEYEVEWKLQGGFELTTYCNVIAKEGHLIALCYTFSRKVDRDSAVDEAKAILKTIDLNP